jgi:hypothetical protein
MEISELLQLGIVVPEAAMQPFDTSVRGNISDKKTFGPDFALRSGTTD